MIEPFFMEGEGETTNRPPTSSDAPQPQVDEIADLWRDFLSNSTLHGLHIALGANTRPCRRLVWCVFIFVCTCFLIVQLVKSYGTFLEYRVLYESRDEYQESLPFPAVSICNNNMMRRSRINGTDAQRYLDNLDGLKNRSHYGWNSSFDAEKAVQLYGHNISEMLKECTWQTATKCSAQDFVSFLDFRHGLCYTFNSGRNQDVRNVRKAHSTHGLSLTLDAQPEEYYGSFSRDATGFKLVVHDQGHHPVMENEALEVSPGFKTIIKVTRHEVNALPPPYTNKCGEKELYSSKKYSRNLCFNECRGLVLKQKCNCRVLGLPSAAELNAPQCTPSEITNCTTRVLNNIALTKCNCPVPCKKTFYSKQMSSAYFPSEHYWETKLSEIREATTREYQERFRKRMAKVNVFYESLIKKEVTEKKAYELSDIGGAVGGNMGLFLGCSILTLCEFADFLILVFLALRKKRTRCGENSQKIVTAHRSGRASVSSAGGRGFESRPDQHSGS